MQKREEDRRRHRNQLFHHHPRKSDFPNENDIPDDNDDDSSWSFRRRLIRRYKSWFRRFKEIDESDNLLLQNLREQHSDLRDGDLMYLVQCGKRSKQTHVREACV